MFWKKKKLNVTNMKTNKLKKVAILLTLFYRFNFVKKKSKNNCRLIIAEGNGERNRAGTYVQIIICRNEGG